jgi:hypothetical protein
MAMSKLCKPNSGLTPPIENPLILFVPKVKKVGGDGLNADKTELIKFDFFVDSENPASKYSKEFENVKDGGPEGWIKWLMGCRDIKTVMPLKEPLEKTKMLCTLLKGRALSQFEYYLRNRLGAEDIALPDCLDELIQMPYYSFAIIILIVCIYIFSRKELLVHLLGY